MPSPLAHATMGFVMYRVWRVRTSEKLFTGIGMPNLLLATVGLSLLADVDFAIGLFMGDVGRFHNNVMHSLVFGILVAAGIGLAVWFGQRSGFIRWFIIAFVCYDLHVIMDYLTVSRGVMLLWPFSLDRFESPIKLFYGLRWSEGWMSVTHLWTLVTEMGFVIALLLLTDLCWRVRREWADGPRSHRTPPADPVQSS